MNKTFFAPITLCTQQPHNEMSVGHRIVGCFENFLLARTCVLENLGDIYENGYYEHAIIEELPFRLYPIPEQQFYYHWETDQSGKGVYVSKPFPEYLKGQLFFS